MSGHGCSFVITTWTPAVNWHADCKCGLKWDGPTYEGVEDGWREHVHATTGKAPKAMGEKQGRWTP